MSTNCFLTLQKDYDGDAKDEKEYPYYYGPI
jgi:hypothetical protein